MQRYYTCIIAVVTLLASAGAHARNLGPFRTGDDGWFFSMLSALAGMG